MIDEERMLHYYSNDDLQNITAKKIAECAKSGKEDALKVYDICGRVLGKGLSMVVDFPIYHYLCAATEEVFFRDAK